MDYGKIPENPALSLGKSARGSDESSASVALLQEACIDLEFLGVYGVEDAQAAGRYESFIRASDVTLGLHHLYRDSVALRTFSEEEKRAAGRHWRGLKKRVEAQENAAGVCFSCRQVPPGRDKQGHRHPAQIRFTFGILRQEVITIAKETRGRRRARFAAAAKIVVDAHRSEIASQSKKAPSRTFLRGMDLSTRAKIIMAHMTQAQFEDRQFAAQLYVELGERLGIQPPLPKTARQSINEEPPCNPPLCFLEGTLGGTWPGTDHVPGLGGKSQQRGGFVSVQLAELNPAELFGSVRANRFTFLLKNDATLEAQLELKPRSSRLQVFLTAEFEAKFQELLSRSSTEKLSLIVAARSKSLIHLDDCDRDDAEHLAQFAFAVFETSPERFHVFLALSKGWDRLDQIRRRLITELKELSPAAEVNAGSGSARWPGSQNFKEERRLPKGDYFTVRLVHAVPSRFTTEAELEMAGMLGGRNQETTPASPRAVDRMPDYQRILAGAPPAKSKSRRGNPDRSWADFRWCRMYASWGASQQQIENNLLLVSECARERNARRCSRYINLTATKAIRTAHQWVSDRRELVA